MITNIQALERMKNAYFQRTGKYFFVDWMIHVKLNKRWIVSSISRKIERYRWISPHSWRWSPRKYLSDCPYLPFGMTKPNSSPTAATEETLINRRALIIYFSTFFFIIIHRGLSASKSLGRKPWCCLYQNRISFLLQCLPDMSDLYRNFWKRESILIKNRIEFICHIKLKWINHGWR